MINFLRRFMPAGLMALAGITLLHNIDKPISLDSSNLGVDSGRNIEPAPSPSGSIKEGSSSSNPFLTPQPTVTPGETSSTNKPVIEKERTPTPRVSVQTPVAEPSKNSNLITKEVDGEAINNPYGLTQVRLVIKDSIITDIILLRAPSGESTSYTRASVPVLRKEVLKAQSANVALVSGATYTSDAYLSSVQSALDKVGL